MKEVRQTELLQQFIDSMTFAAGAAWQMIHAHQDPRFIGIRGALEGMKNSCMSIAMAPSDAIAKEIRKPSGIILP